MIVINDEFKEEIECCIANKTYDLALNTGRGRASLADALQVILENNQARIMRPWAPPGTIVSYTANATATLDLTGLDPLEFTDGMRITVSTIYNSANVILCDFYIDLAGQTLAFLKAAIISNINSGGSGYTSTPGAGNIINLAFSGTMSTLPAGTTVTLAFAPYWYRNVDTPIALDAGPADDTFYIYNSVLANYCDSLRAGGALNCAYVESENLLYVPTGAIRKADQSFSANFDGVAHTSSQATTIATGLDTTVYAPGETGFISYFNGVNTITSWRIEITGYNPGTGALTFTGTPIAPSFAIYQGNAPWGSPSDGLPPTTLNLAAMPVLGNVTWFVSMGNGFGDNSTGYGVINVYEWNQGTNALDYVDYITVKGGGISALQYNATLNRVYYVCAQSVGHYGTGYIDISADPFAVASQVYGIVGNSNKTYENPSYNSPTGTYLVGSATFYDFKNNDTTGSQLFLVLPGLSDYSAFDNFDRLLYPVNGATRDIYFRSGFADTTVTVGAAMILCNTGADVTSIEKLCYHTPSTRLYCIVVIGGVRKLRSFDISLASQAEIEGSAKTYTLNGANQVGNNLKYIAGLEKLIINTTTGGLTFLDLTIDTLENNIIPIPTFANERYTTAPSYQYDSVNNHFWVVTNPGNATGTPASTIYTISATTNALEVTGNFSGTVTPNVLDGDNDCQTQLQIENVAQALKAECGCDDCGDNNDVSNIPSTATYTIYYGNQALSTLTNVQVEALGTVSSLTYAGDYAFAADPGTYKYVAYPASLGTPSRIIDASTLLDVVMDSPYSVTINSILYTVYRSYYQLGGAITIQFQS